MAQFFRPDDDLETAGWTTTPLWSKLDEVTPSDSDFVRTATNPVNQDFTVSIAGGVAPQAGTRTLRYRAGKSSSSGRRVDITVEILEGATSRQTFTHTDVPTMQQYNSVVTASITDYSDLRVKVNANVVGGGAGRWAECSWIEFETPDAVSTDRAARVSWAELEIPNADRKARISWAELEVPNPGELDQKAFRVYALGDPATSTALAAENINPASQDDHKVIQLRFGLEETNSGNVPAFIPELWGKKNAGSYERLSDHTWVRAWRDSAWSDNVNTTDRLTTPLGTFTAGKADQVDCITSAITINADQNTEMVYSVIIKRDAGVTSDTWTFELRYAGGGALEAYSQRPVITLNRIAEDLGWIESIDTDTLVNDRDCWAEIAYDASLNIQGIDCEVLWDLNCPQWNPDSPDATIGANWVMSRTTTADNERTMAYQFTNREYATPPQFLPRISNDGTGWPVAHTNNGVNFSGFADGTRIQIRWTFDGDAGSSLTFQQGWDRSSPFDAADLDDGVGWTSRDTDFDAAFTGDINQSTNGLIIYGSMVAAGGGRGGMPNGTEIRRVVWFEGLTQGRRIIDFKTFDRAYRTPEDKLSSVHKEWVNQGEVAAPIIWNGAENTIFKWVAASTDRKAQVSWAELEIPIAPRKARVSWAELEIPNAARAARVSWAELEIPTAPRKAMVSWAELEVPTAPRRARVSWAELEVPSGPRKARVSWAELEIPDVPPRKARVSWAEFEVPTAPRKARVSWAELEVPNAPRKARVSWAELEIPDVPPRKALVSWAELEIPGTLRRARVSWAEFEVPIAPRKGRVSWAEFEVPEAPRKARISWAELEVPTAPRKAKVSWAEFEIPDVPRRARVSWAEFEIPDVPVGPRRGRVSWAEFEIPAVDRAARISWAEFEVPEIPTFIGATPLIASSIRWVRFWQEDTDEGRRGMKIWEPSLEAETGIAAGPWINVWQHSHVTIHVWGLIAGDVVKFESTLEAIPGPGVIVIRPGDIVTDDIYKISFPARWIRVNKTANAGGGSVNAIVLAHE